MRKKITSIATSLLLMTTLFVYAEEGKLTGEKILKTHIRKTGGNKNYKKIKNKVSRFTAEYQGMNFSMTGTSYEVKPDKKLTILEVPGRGIQKTGTDGKTHWVMNGRSPSLLSGAQKEANKRRSTFNHILNWKKLFKSTEYMGTEAAENETCYKVKMTTEGEREEYWLFSKKSGYLLKTSSTVQTRSGPVTTTTTFSEYKKVSGIKFPHKEVQKGVNVTTVITYTNIECDGEIPEDYLSPPEEVQNLIRAQEELKKVTDRITHKNGTTYSIYTPENTEESQAIIFALHGAGGNDSNFMQFWYPPAKKHNCILICPKSAGSAWGTDDALNLLEIINEVKESAKSKNTYIIGYSNGGFMAYTLGLANPDIFDGIGAFAAGYGNTDIPTEAKALRIFISHGSNDNINMTRMVKEALEENGNPVDYHEMENGGHTVFIQHVKPFFNWLLNTDN